MLPYQEIPFNMTWLTKGSSTLWTPFLAIELVTLSNYFRVFI